MPTPAQYTQIDRKYYEYKIYEPDGTYITSWTDVISDFTYSQDINSGGSSVNVTLARSASTGSVDVYNLITEGEDTFITEGGDAIVAITDSPFTISGDTDVALNNLVEVYVFYGRVGTLTTQGGDDFITESGDTLMVNDGAVNGRIIFSGYISKFVAQYGNNEVTKVTVLSHGTEMANYILEDGSDTTVSYASDDPKDILEDVLDKFTASGGLVDYDSTSISTTGNTVSYQFKVNTIYEAVQKCAEMAPTDWFWYLNMGSNILYLKPRPTAVSHTFVLGKHIENLEVEYKIENLVNKVYFSGGDTGSGENLFRKFTDQDSIDEWRQGLHKASDNRVTDSMSAGIIGQSIIERYKNPRYSSTVTISDTSYIIEDIELGQLVEFKGFNNFIDNLTLQVVGISYSPYSVTLRLDTLLPKMNKRVEDIKRNMDKLDVLDNPDTPS